MTADGKIPVLSGGPAGTGSAGGAVTGCGVWPLYVGLFLALLTFFIVLVARAPLDSARTSAVLHGVQRTFAPTPPPPGAALFVAGRSALVELGGDLAGIIRIARVEYARGGGDEMRVRLDTLGLFTDGTAALRPEIAPMLDRIIAALGSPPQGLRLEAAFTLGRPAPGEAAGSDGGGVALAVARCAAVARALVARGAAPATIATGMGSGPPEDAVFAFRLRPDGRTAAAGPGVPLRLGVPPR